MEGHAERMGGDTVNGPGFYKEDMGVLLYAETMVSGGAGFSLNATDHLTYAYPVEGWTWYESETDARIAEGLPVDTNATASVLDVLSTTPIDLAVLTVNLDYLAAFVNNTTVAAVSEDTARLVTLIEEMATFVGNPTPTAEQAFSAVRAVCENSVIVDRVALAVLADTIRYILQTPPGAQP
jgi:hypothetical protein